MCWVCPYFFTHLAGCKIHVQDTMSRKPEGSQLVAAPCFSKHRFVDALALTRMEAGMGGLEDDQFVAFGPFRACPLAQYVALPVSAVLATEAKSKD